MAGRPRKAEPEVALAAAMSAFWEKGYEGTSMSDLTEATGLHKASLYKSLPNGPRTIRTELFAGNRLLESRLDAHARRAEQTEETVDVAAVKLRLGARRDAEAYHAKQRMLVLDAMQRLVVDAHVGLRLRRVRGHRRGGSDSLVSKKATTRNFLLGARLCFTLQPS